MDFWDEEERMRRIAKYRARFLSWKTGRPVRLYSTFPGDHWWYMPLMWDDTGEPVTIAVVLE